MDQSQLHTRGYPLLHKVKYRNDIHAGGLYPPTHCPSRSYAAAPSMPTGTEQELGSSDTAPRPAGPDSFGLKLCSDTGTYKSGMPMCLALAAAAARRDQV